MPGSAHQGQRQETAVFDLETSLSLHPSHSTQLRPHGRTPGTCAEVSIPALLASFFLCLNPTETHSLPAVPAMCLYHSSSLRLHLCLDTLSNSRSLLSDKSKWKDFSICASSPNSHFTHLCIFRGKSVHSLSATMNFLHPFILKRSSNKTYIPSSPIFWGLLKINMVPDVKSKTT